MGVDFLQRRVKYYCSSVLLLVVLIFSNNFIFAESNQTISEQEADLFTGYTYQHYLEDHKSQPFANKEILVKAATTQQTTGKVVNSVVNKDNVLVLENGEEAAWQIDVKESGYYSIQLDYCSTGASNRNFDLVYMIDEKIPFEQSQNLVLSKIWRDEDTKDGSRFRMDSRGNELMPRSVEVKEWQSRFFTDSEGFYAEPFNFYFESGRHTITLKANQGGIAIDTLKLRAFPKSKAYNDVEDIYTSNKYTSAPTDSQVKWQAEETFTKSDPVLHPTYDRSSASSEPADPAKMRLNTFGQLNWKYAGQWASWKFEVPADGLYTIAARVRQNFVRGVETSRKVIIDEKVPYKELESVKFPFSNNWYFKTLGENEAKAIYLTKGIHAITLEVAPSYPEVIRQLQHNVYTLNGLYRKIIMITSTMPDELRDYELEKQIPNFAASINDTINELKQLRQFMEDRGFSKGGEAVIVEQLIHQMESFLDKPDTIASESRLKMFKDNIASAAALIIRLKEQPLEIDYFLVSPLEHKLSTKSHDFFADAIFSFRAFVASFFNKYTTIDNKYETGEALEVWVGLGRDQVQIVKQLVDDYFIEQYKVPVNVNLVQQGLVPATLTGRGPDMALFVNPNDVVNLAARNALVDIGKYKDYPTITQRFQKQSMNPYKYMGGSYGLPVNESFFMMFYRKDILAELGVKPPKTWDDFYDTIPLLQRNNLSVGILSNEVTFQNLLFQTGGSYYKGDWKSTGFDDPNALKAFKQWTDFYSKYTLPVEFDFYSRFRTGEMPLGINVYTTYNVLNAAAPEIKGMWDMTAIPGTVGADGTINHSVAGAGSGIVMFDKTKNKDGAWEFMKWWTSAETQSRFSKELEIIMGPAARFDTANVEAFKTLAWTEKERNKLLEQWKDINIVPQTPVSYYIGRNLTNAFRKVVYKFQNPRETLNLYNRDMNKEIRRKRDEFGLK